MAPKIKKISFKLLASALLDESTPFPAHYLHRFSDLDSPDAAQLEKIWPRISLHRRQALMEDLEMLGEADDLLSFEAVCKLALHDTDPRLRLLAVRILTDYENLDLLPTFMQMAEKDADADVRTAAVTALAPFVYLGEVDALTPALLQRIEDCLLHIINGTDIPPIRCRALESLCYSSRPELIPLIETAYTSGDIDWLVSALFAMGHSADNRWDRQVLAMLVHLRPAVRGEAATAAGELEIEDSRPLLLENLEDSDEAVRMASIWALSQLGGEGVGQTLVHLLETTTDESEAQLIEEALDNLAFTVGVDAFTLIDYADSNKINDDDLADYEEDEDFSDSFNDEDIDAEDIEA